MASGARTCDVPAGLAALYARTRLNVHPPRYDAFGMSIVEAAAFGAPTVFPPGADVGAKLINDARARGVDIWAAHHPYTATQSSLSAYTIPRWASAGGQEELVSRFDDAETDAEITSATNEMLEIRGGADQIMFVDRRADLNGKTLADVAGERELSPADTVKWILRDGEASVMNLELYDHSNTRRLAQEPWMMTCTDGRTPHPETPITHPRTFGAFPKKMRHFVFEEDLLTPEFIIRSYSGLAADFLLSGDIDAFFAIGGLPIEAVEVDELHAAVASPKKGNQPAIALLADRMGDVAARGFTWLWRRQRGL